MKSLLAVALLGAAGCAGSPDARDAMIVEEVTRATRAFERAERERDAERVLGFLDPEFYMYVDGSRVDYATVVEQIGSTMPTLQRFDAEFSDLEVIVLGPGGASVSFTFRDVITDAQGTTTRKKGATTMLWKRRGKDWRIVYVDADHYPDEGS